MTVAIEDIYPLSPMQEGFLFHSLYDPDSSAYLEQFTFELAGSLDISSFERAWQAVINRHPAMRTAFLWEDLDEPLQVVYRQVQLPLAQHDWCSLSLNEQQARLDAYLSLDRSHGFELSRPPLTRVALIQVAKNSYHFVWSQHHLLLDGWSMSLILQEALAYYEAFAQNQELHLEPSRPYRDYIAWLQQLDHGAAEAFWRRALKDFTVPTPLVIGRMVNEGSLNTKSYAEDQFVVPEATTAGLHAVARQHRLTTSTLLEGAWSLLLSRYSGEQDVLFGMTVATRPENLAGSDRIVGLCMNTVPVRVEVPAKVALHEWLRELQDKQLEARQHYYSSLARIQAWSELPRATPLFESAFVYENYPMGIWLQKARTGLEIRNVRFLEQTHYPLAAQAVPIPDQLLLKIVYDDQRFDASTIKRMLGHWQTLLAAVASRPDQCLSALPLLTSSERHQLLSQWNDTQTDYPHTAYVHSLFEQQVERTPNAVAIICEDTQVTYLALNRRANQLAHHLQRLGVGPDTCVGLCVERSVDMIVSVLAILKAGGAYVPLDPGYPAERLAFMLQDAHIGVLVTQQRLLEDSNWRFAGDRAQPGLHGRKEVEYPNPLSANLASLSSVVCLDTDTDAIDSECQTNPICRVLPHHLAYVIYTSGSTGMPKGVMVAHRSLANHAPTLQATYGLQPGKRFLLFVSLSFDAAAAVLFPTLISGATLIVPTATIDLAGHNLLELCAQCDVTTLDLPVAFWHQWVAELAANQWKLPPSIEVLLVGGESPGVDKLRTWAHLIAQPSRFLNAYGPTEATITTTLFETDCDEASLARITHVPIGRPIDNQRVYVLDAAQQPVPIEVPGELYIGGLGLARGYLNRPDLTAEQFLPDPFRDEPGARMYRTGDMVRYLLDGNLEFLGRRDEQVKVRGYRIELGEIEAALRLHPDIKDAAVIAHQDAADGSRRSILQRLVAFIVPQQGLAPLPPDLRSFLQTKLPSYMIPSAFVLLDELPLTANGKVHRGLLSSTDLPDPVPTEIFVAPRTSAEQVLADIWTRVLDLEQVGIHDDFFALGGDSILSIQIIARARQAGVYFTPRQLFDHPTIAQVAALAASAPQPEPDEVDNGGPLRLTPIQHWFFEQELPDPQHYNQAVLLETHTALAPALLEQAVAHLLAHHDALRLRFMPQPDGWQVVCAAPEAAPPCRHCDLSALPASAQRQAIERTASEAQASLDLAQGPLLRVVSFDLGAGQRGRLLLVCHHLVVDGVSWSILLEDLQTLYSQLGQDEPLHLPPKTTSYRRWSDGLAAYAQSTALQQELRFWLSQPEASPSRLPVDLAAAAALNTVASAQSVVVRLPAAETHALLRAVPKAYNTQINDVLLTALLRAFVDWTGERTLLLEIEGHGREEVIDGVDLSRTVGWFTTLYPVHLTLPSAVNPADALKSVKEQLRSIPNRGIGYGVLRYLCKDAESVEKLRALPQPELAFNYLGPLDRELSESGLFCLARESSGAAHSHRGLRQHLIEVNGSIVGGQLQMHWSYSEHIHWRATIEGLAQRYIEALRELTACCQSSITLGNTPSDFPLVELDQQSLDHLIRSYAPLEDVYPLTPSQQGILFYALFAPESVVYFSQLSWAFHGRLNVQAFERAWQHVLDRHSVLRTSFTWEGLPGAVQVVQRHVRLPWKKFDWRGLSSNEQQAQLEAYLESDRRRGFDLSKAPLMRMALIQLSEDVYQFVWSQHHILLDGWCLPLILQEVFGLYAAFCTGQGVDLEPSRPYRDYVAWLQRQDPAHAEVFWRATLKDFTEPTPLPVGKVVESLPDAEDDYDEQEIRLPAVTANALHTLVRQHKLTLNTLVQGIWAVLLSHCSGRQDVVFGSTFSGRPVDLPGVESMLGLFLNTLPVRVYLAPQAACLPWLQQLQLQIVDLCQYEQTPLGQIHRWSQLPPRQPLFESVVVFENYAMHFPVPDDFGDLKIRDSRSFTRNHFPLTIRAVPAREFSLHILYDCHRFDRAVVGALLGHFELLLQQLATQPDIKLCDLADLLADADRQRQISEASESAAISLQKLQKAKRKPKIFSPPMS